MTHVARRRPDIWGQSTAVSTTPSASEASPAVLQVDSKLEQQVVRGVKPLVDAAALTRMTPDEQVTYLRDLIAAFASREGIGVSGADERAISERLAADLTGYGPIQPFLSDPTVSDILVRGTDSIAIDRSGLLEETTARFATIEDLVNVARKMAEVSGRSVSSGAPICDTRLPDGSRVNIIMAPLAQCGCIISIRKFLRRLDLASLEKRGAFDERMRRFLRLAIELRANILVSGGTGSGKTSLLNALSEFIPDHEHIVTIEDSAELRLTQRFWSSLETRKATTDARGTEVTIADLVRNSLRMRPDRIIVGEVRSSEAFDLLQVMNTGHDGSMGTLHANDPSDVIERVEGMIQQARNLSRAAITSMFSSAVDIIVHTERDSDGARRIRSITEVSGINRGDANSQPNLFYTSLFDWKPTGKKDSHGLFTGHWEASTVLPPKLRERAVRVGREAELRELFVADAGGWP